MRNRRGVVLPGAIVLCTILLIVSMTVSFLVINNATSNQIETMLDNRRIDFETGYYQFVKDDGALDPEKPAYATGYVWAEYDGADDIKAIAAYSKAGSLLFYAVYDFGAADTLLAYQDDVLYVYESEGHRYLGGIVEEIILATPESSSEQTEEVPL